MRNLQNCRRLLTLIFALSICLLSADQSYGKKGGGGKPGGEDPPPPALPVNYTVTAPTMPHATFVFNDHNESGAVVGWNYGGDGPDDARPVVYLPDVSSTEAYYLDHPALVLPAMPIGYENWHTRSAVAINNHGDIGGNVEPFGNVNNDSQAFLFVRSEPTPRLVIFDRQDPTADREVVLALNDGGDTLIASFKSVNGVNETRYYIGNPEGLYGNNPVPFEEVDLSLFGPYSRADVFGLSNPVAGGEAVLVGSVTNDVKGEAEVFRMSLDGSEFEVFQDYQGDDGNYYSISPTFVVEMNDLGDISALGVTSSKPDGKGKIYGFPAVWPYGTNELVAATGGDTQAAPWELALINNSGDALLGAESLWHSDYSPANGLISIADAIDPNDLNRQLFQGGLELTDHGPTDWPMILAYGDEVIDGVERDRLLILRPELISASQLTASTQQAITAVPEPQTVTLLACAALIGLLAQRQRNDELRALGDRAP